jgi:hypothetical protein
MKAARSAVAPEDIAGDRTAGARLPDSMRQPSPGSGHWNGSILSRDRAAGGSQGPTVGAVHGLCWSPGRNVHRWVRRRDGRRSVVRPPSSPPDAALTSGGKQCPHAGVAWFVCSRVVPESLEVVEAKKQGQMAINDLADYLGVTHHRVHQMSHQLPAPRLIAGRRMWSRVKIEEWAERLCWGTKPWRRRSATVDV